MLHRLDDAVMPILLELRCETKNIGDQAVDLQ